MIKGIEVIAYINEIQGKDALGNDILKEKEVLLDNVLVSPLASEDVLGIANLNTDKINYQMAIPKMYDDIDFTDANFVFFGKKWKIVGSPYKGIDALIPLQWNTKIQVVNYE